MDIQSMVLWEISHFLVKQGTKPSHRIYALGFLNKIANSLISDGNPESRQTLLQIYFNLFNKLLH
jgi:hypothetical protein